MLFCYIGWHLGYDGLILVGEVVIPDWLNVLIGSILCLVQLSLVGSYILNYYSFKILKFTIPLIIVADISCLFLGFGLVSGPIATLYFIIIGILKKDTKRSLLRALVITVLTIGYQAVAVFLKTGKLDFNYQMPVYTALMFSIDMILLTLLIWMIGGAQNVSKLEFLVFPGRIRDERISSESSKASPQVIDGVQVSKFEQWLMGAVLIVVQVLQWMFILWICSFDNPFLDVLVMTTSFICHSMIIAKRKHLKPIILCTLAATAMFYVAARFTISFQYSQFFSIVIGLVLVYMVYRIGYYFEMKAKTKARAEIKRIEALEVQIAKAWEQLDRLS